MADVETCFEGVGIFNKLFAAMNFGSLISGVMLVLTHGNKYFSEMLVGKGA